MWQALASKVFKVREKFALNLSSPDEEKPFLDHLEDLRKMVVRMALTLLVATVGTFSFYKYLFELIKKPLWWSSIVKTSEDLKGMLETLTPQEGFMMMMNLSLVAAIIIASPLLLFFLLQFVVPGLRDNEKKMLFPAILIGAGLFLIGAMFSYFQVLPRALNFFADFNTGMGIGNGWRLDGYIKFATRFVLLFGVAFELPVVVMALVKLDILSFKLMNTTRSYAVIAIAVFSAIVTPTPDPFTMLIMAAPLYLMYEACIWLAYYLEKKDRAMYPEYYKELEKDEAALATEDSSTTDWDKEDYNPWSSADDEDDDEAIKPRPAAGRVSTTGEKTEPPAAEKSEDKAAGEEQEYKNQD